MPARLAELLGYTVISGEVPLATWIPGGVDPHPNAGRPPRGARVALSRFAYAHRVGDAMVLESPAAFGQLRFHDPEAFSVIARLTRPRRIAELIKASPLPRAVTRQFLDLLWRHHFLSTGTDSRAGGDRQNTALEAWEFHDLLFHARSRHGRHREGYGARPRSAKTQVPDAPFQKPGTSGVISLPRPDLDRLRQNDVPLTAVVEDRQTQRRHDGAPLTIGELGEFLYRTARARRRSFGGSVGEGFDRIAPTGGAAYELDVYLAIRPR